MHVLGLYFGLPSGAVWSNLVASAICTGLAWWRLRARAIRHHGEAMAQKDAHHAEAMAQARAHHEDMKAHVTAVRDGSVTGG